MMVFASVWMADRQREGFAAVRHTLEVQTERRAAETDPGHTEKLAALSPVRRLAEPEEVAEAVVRQCSGTASYVLGHTMLVEGGALPG